MTIKITKYRNLYSRNRHLTKHTEKCRVPKDQMKNLMPTHVSQLVSPLFATLKRNDEFL